MKCPYCQSNHVIRRGFSGPLKCLSGQHRQRFQCRNCCRRFCSNSCSINFRLKKKDLALNSKIFFFFVRGLSNRQIALALSLSESCVRLRLDRMAKQALCFHSQKTKNLQINEPIAFDGLENFSRSQYDPNNINHAIGFDSLFVYDFNYAPLNRKGRISPRQKQRLLKIENSEGRYNPKAIRIAAGDILERLCDQTPHLELLSDEHFQYKRAIERDLSRKNIRQKTISSKACRNFQNILFAVNHTDLMLRQRVAAFARETISFSKTAGAMCQKYMLYAAYKNYMVPQFTKKHIKRPFAHLHSPAQAAGITDKILKFSDIFHSHSQQKAAQQSLNSDWQFFWEAKVPLKHLRNLKYVRKSK